MWLHRLHSESRVHSFTSRSVGVPVLVADATISRVHELLREVMIQIALFRAASTSADAQKDVIIRACLLCKN